jgi:hypothetical protein
MKTTAFDRTMTQPNLSVGARLLLCAAAKSGQIIVGQDSAGLHVTTGGKFFGAAPGDPRRKAEVESELNELAVLYGFITPEGTVRTVTHRGYLWINENCPDEIPAAQSRD